MRLHDLAKLVFVGLGQGVRGFVGRARNEGMELLARKGREGRAEDGRPLLVMLK